jgi:hypothetical protein
MPKSIAADPEQRAGAPFALGADGEPIVGLRRRFPTRYIKFRSFNHSSHELNDATPRRRTALIALSRGLWDELRDGYDVAMPYTVYVVGSEPAEQLERPYIPHEPWQHKPGYYTVAEEVIGITLEEALVSGSEELIREVDHVFSRLGDYLNDKLHSSGWFVTDMCIDQFMYGRTHVDPVLRAYFVDQEPLFSRHLDIQEDGRDFDSLVGKAGDLVDMILAAEAILGRKLGVTRRSADRLLRSFPQNLRGADMIRRKREQLAGHDEATR